MGRPKLVDDDIEVLSPKELSGYIKELSKVGKDIVNNGYLTKRAMLLLLHDALPQHPRKAGKLMGIRDLEKVLDTIEHLAETYCVVE